VCLADRIIQKARDGSVNSGNALRFGFQGHALTALLRSVEPEGAAGEGTPTDSYLGQRDYVLIF